MKANNDRPYETTIVAVAESTINPTPDPKLGNSLKSSLILNKKVKLYMPQLQIIEERTWAAEGGFKAYLNYLNEQLGKTTNDDEKLIYEKLNYFNSKGDKELSRFLSKYPNWRPIISAFIRAGKSINKFSNDALSRGLLSEELTSALNQGAVELLRDPSLSLKNLSTREKLASEGEDPMVSTLVTSCGDSALFTHAAAKRFASNIQRISYQRNSF